MITASTRGCTQRELSSVFLFLKFEGTDWSRNGRVDQRTIPARNVTKFMEEKKVIQKSDVTKVIKHGMCSWTDESFIKCGKFYPTNSKLNATERLKIYANHFPCVEVDMSTYTIPSKFNCEKWVQVENHVVCVMRSVPLHRFYFISRHFRCSLILLVNTPLFQAEFVRSFPLLQVLLKTHMERKKFPGMNSILKYRFNFAKQTNWY